MPTEFVISVLEQAVHSVIAYDRSGNRQIHVDLKDSQDQPYPSSHYEEALARCDFAIPCNINYSRPFLSLVKSRGIPVATDLHTISDHNDLYNVDLWPKLIFTS